MIFSLSEIRRIFPIAKRRIGATIVSWIQHIFSSEKLVKDVFGTNSDKRVLLCHLPEAFAGGALPKHHSNLTECYTVAKCFARLGYSVDCTSRAKSDIDYSCYSVIFGINGNAFFNSFTASRETNPLRIFYSVGAHTCYNYKVTTERNCDFYKRHERWLLGSNRYIPGDARNYYEARFADAVICLGDTNVVQQFIEDDPSPNHYRQLSSFYFPVAQPDKNKDFSKCRKNILWFGSMGFIHKGLDIAIDYALAHPDYTLHICGSSNEPEFWSYYRPKIKGSNNIIVHGFVDIESREFVSLLDECAVLMNPSISEGGAVSVLNVLGNGALLPVYSRGTGLNLEKTGVEVPIVTYDSFDAAMLSVDSMTAEEMAERAWATHKFVRDNYTLELYEERMFRHIKEIIDNSDKR